MRIGKVSGNILDRSILRPIRPRRAEVLSGAGVGHDGSVYAAGNRAMVLAHSVCFLDHAGRILSLSCGFYRGINELAARLAEPCGLEVSLVLPEAWEEPELKKIMSHLDHLAERENMEITGGHTTTARGVSVPVVHLTFIGYSHKRTETPKKFKKGFRWKTEIVYEAKQNQDLVLTKWIGLEGTALLAIEREEELAKRYPADFLYSAKEMIRKISALPEAAVAGKHGVTAMHNLSEGGVLGALYEFTENSDVGMDIDLKKIPIRQETVEICEYYHINPYQLASSGSMLMACEDGEALVEALQKAGIPACIIGKTLAGNARVIRNEDELRFLDRPGMDEIWKEFVEEL